MKLENVKIHKMGNKFGIYFSKFYFPKGSLIQIKIIKGDKLCRVKNTALKDSPEPCQ